MRQLRFRITCLSQNGLQRPRKPQGQRKPGRWLRSGKSAFLLTRGTALLWSVVALAAVHAITWKPTARVSGVPVVGQRVLVMIDSSGSMQGTEKKLEEQLAALRASGISAESRVQILGFGVSTAGCRSNLLKALEMALTLEPEKITADAVEFCQSFEDGYAKANSEPARGSFDSVYVFSDFNFMDRPVDGNDAAGCDRLRQLLRERGLRLYLSTVNKLPADELVRIARESGGDLIPSQ